MQTRAAGTGRAEAIPGGHLTGAGRICRLKCGTEGAIKENRR